MTKVRRIQSELEAAEERADAAEMAAKRRPAAAGGRTSGRAGGRTPGRSSREVIIPDDDDDSS